MSFADIQQIDLLDHKKKRQTSKDSTSSSEGLGSNRVGSAPGGMGKSYTYLKRDIRRLLGILQTTLTQLQVVANPSRSFGNVNECPRSLNSKLHLKK
jgi:hypothetical protein